MATVSLPAIQSSNFFEILSHRHRGVLVIDYDSTIARLGNADCVFPYPTVQELIDCILASTGTRVVLATRRPAQELRSCFALPGPEICTPEAALSMEKSSGDYPLAYLRGDGGTAKLAAASRLRVCPRYQVGRQKQAVAPPEEMVQFLAEWLRACSGEVC
jgi:hypothetical protein